MPDSWVSLHSAGKPPRRVPIRINGRDPTFVFRNDDVETQFQAPMDDLLFDLSEVASAIFLADTSFPRGGDTRSGLGAAWRRELDFHLTVRNPEFWMQDGVTSALSDAVGFLAGDHVTFQFDGKPGETHTEPYLRFDGDEGVFQADEVILFSGGLDSFAGAIEALKNRAHNVILVTHRSAPKAILRQVELGKVLKRDFGRRLLHVHIQATRKASTSRETTQRTRSFLFASLGYIVARMAGAQRVSFYENGIVSQNLPISPQVVETMASRTTHPLALAKIQKFFDTLGEPRIGIQNEFQWLTKKQVVEKIADLGYAKEIRLSVSCTKLRNEKNDKHHCGTCSQCLDRRFAILAAGLGHYDPSSGYQTEVLLDSRPPGRSRSMALDWSSHAIRLADMSLIDFAERFTSDLVRIAQAYPETSNDVVTRSFEMQRAHGLAVRSVLEEMTRQHAKDLFRGQLEKFSLLVMLIGNLSTELPDVSDGLTSASVSPEELPSSTEQSVRRATIFPLRVAFFEERKVRTIEVEGLGCVRDGPAAVAHDLKPQYEADLAEGLAPENHRYLTSKDLAMKRRPVATNTVYQMVKRCRVELAELYEAIEGRLPDNNLLIENHRPLGYRLDPMIRIIRRDQIGTRGKD